MGKAGPGAGALHGWQGITFPSQKDRRKEQIRCKLVYWVCVRRLMHLTQIKVKGCAHSEECVEGVRRMIKCRKTGPHMAAENTQDDGWVRARDLIWVSHRWWIRGRVPLLGRPLSQSSSVFGGVCWVGPQPPTSSWDRHSPLLPLRGLPGQH